MTTTIRTVTTTALSLSMLAAATHVEAHHSFSRFDQDRIVEVQGSLVSFRWRNPHIRFEIRGTDDAGNEVTWDIEGHSVSILRRTNASPERLQVGDTVRLAGWPTVLPSSEIFVHNLLMPDGTELILQAGAPQRWSTGETLGEESIWRTSGTATANVGRQGLFRVWSTQFGNVGRLWLDSYPLTAYGQEKFAEWDPLTDTAAPGCKPKGMPLIMEQPYPIEFLQQDDAIILRMEEYDTVRTIAMTGDAVPAAAGKTILGNSRGHWEGDTLVVETTGVDFPLFDSFGTPQGSDPHFVERFRVSDDGSELLYELVATDEEVFTEPVKITRQWVWRPGEEVKPYECVESD